MQRNGYSPVKEKTKNFELILVYQNSMKNFRIGLIPYSALFIQAALRQIGIEPKILDINDVERLEAFRRDTSLPQIWAIGSCSEMYERIRDICLSIKNVDPARRFIVLGGPITESELVNAAYLINGWIDAINYGHAQPFISFMAIVASMVFDLEQYISLAGKQGLAIREKHSVFLGAFPKLEEIPLSIVTVDNSEGKELRLILPSYDTCGNKCKYCTTPCSRMPDLTKKIVQAVKNLVIKNEQKITHMYFTNSTFTDKVNKNMREIYKAAGDNKIKTTLTIGGEVFAPKRYSETMQILREMNVHTATLAVDCVDEQVATAIGRNFEEEVRGQEMLDEEQRGIIRFLNDNHDWILEGETMRLQINMILSPFDTPRSIEKIMGFFRKVFFVQQLRSYLDIHFVMFGLIPYPSSDLFKIYTKNIDLKKLILNPKQDLVFYNTKIWRFPEEMYGLSFINKFRILFTAALAVGAEKRSRQVTNYLFIEGLSMTQQYLQGIASFEKMDLDCLNYPGYIEDLNRMHEALVPQTS